MFELNQRIISCLNISDGRILYRYRLLQHDYINLKSYLAENHHVFDDINTVTRHTSDWDKLFVLYASEWSRREYTGGSWRWEDILKSININGQISHAHLMKLTEQGLKKWRRQLFINPNTGARQALGTFMREGGLAITYFNTTGGWIETLLTQLIKNKIEQQIPAIVLEKYSLLIPSSIDREQVIVTLLELTNDIYQLVTTYQLDLQSDPVAYLNQNVPDWQNSFPFSLEEQSAQELIQNLIMDSVREQSEYSKRQATKPSPHSQEIRLTRQIIVNSITHATLLKAFIKLPTRIALNEESFALVNTDSLSLNFFKQTLNLLNEVDTQDEYSQDNLLTTRQLSPVSNQRILMLRDDNPIIIQSENWYVGISMQIRTPTGDIPHFVNEKLQPINPYQNFSMYEIDANLPFLAEIEEENEQIIATYAGSGSWTSKQPCALVYLPQGCEANMANFPNAKLEKLSDILQGILYKLTGEIQVYAVDNTTSKAVTYTLKTDSLDANYLYEIQGQQLLDFVYPAMTFRGEISVYKIEVETAERSQVKDRDIFIKACDTSFYQPLTMLDKKTLFGRFQLRIKAENDQTIFEQTIGIVPSHFRYKLKPLSTPSSQYKQGLIEFSSVNPAMLSISDSSQSIEVTSKPDKASFELGTLQVPVKKMTVSLYPKRGITHKQNLLKFNCYFPTSQTLIINDKGEVLTDNLNVLININDSLYGYRINLYNALRQTQATLSFYLESDKAQRIEYPICINAHDFRQLEPYTWKAEIAKLLAFSNVGLNDSVIAEIMMANQYHVKIRFVYYEFELHRPPIAPNQLKIKYNKFLSQSHNFNNPMLQQIENNTQLLAFNFESPEQELLILPKYDDYWDLQAIDKHTETTGQQGTWLIFSEVLLQGHLLPNHEPVPPDDTLLQKIHHSIRTTAYTPKSHHILEADNLTDDNVVDNSLDPNDVLKAVEVNEPNDTDTMTDSMRYASRKGETKARQKQIKRALRKMAFDPHHADWTYLQDLSQRCTNLPLTALDNWYMARYVPEFMLAVTVYQGEILDKVICDKCIEQIGFHWELVNLHDFHRIWQSYQTFLDQKFAMITSKDIIIEQMITTKKNYLEEISMGFKAFLTTQSSMPANRDMVKNILNRQFESLVISKNLKNAQWIEEDNLLGLVESLWQIIDGTQKLSIILLENHTYRKLVALLPICLAWLACQKNLSPELYNIHKALLKQSIAIYKVKQFDTAWF